MLLRSEVDACLVKTEILEYAEFLGIDCEREKDLLWIARAGLKASLPHGWKPC